MKLGMHLTGLMLGAAALIGASLVDAADVARGKATYGELCAKCHGPSGKGDGKEAATLATKPKDLTDCPRVAKFNDDQLRKIVKEGGASSELSKDMPAYKDSIEDDEITDTVAYIRTLCPK